MADVIITGDTQNLQVSVDQATKKIALLEKEITILDGKLKTQEKTIATLSSQHTNLAKAVTASSASLSSLAAVQGKYKDSMTELNTKLSDQYAKMTKIAGATDIYYGNLRKAGEATLTLKSQISGLNSAFAEKASLQGRLNLLSNASYVAMKKESEALKEQIKLKEIEVGLRAAEAPAKQKAAGASLALAQALDREAAARLRLSMLGNDAYVASLRNTRDLDNQIRSRMQGLGLIDREVEATNRLNSAQRALHQTTRGLSGAMGGLWLTYGKPMAPMVAAFAATMGVMKSFKEGIEFEYLTTFSASLSEGAISAKTLGEELLKLRNVGMVPKELAAGFLELTKAGMEANESLKALPTTARYAAVGQLDLGKATEQLVTMTNAFRSTSKGLREETLSVADTADIIAYAAQKSVASFGDIQHAFNYMTGTASTAKFSIQEVAGALMIMADRGLKGSLGATGLRTAFERLINPTEKASRLFKAVGGNIDAIYKDGKISGIQDLGKELARIKDTVDDKAWSEFAFAAFGLRGIKINAFIDDIAKLDQNLKGLAGSMGFVDGVYQDLAKTSKFVLKELSASFDRLFISAFEGEATVQFLTKLKDLIESPTLALALKGLVDGVTRLGTLSLPDSPVIDFLDLLTTSLKKAKEAKEEFDKVFSKSPDTDYKLPQQLGSGIGTAMADLALRESRKPDSSRLGILDWLIDAMAIEEKKIEPAFNSIREQYEVHLSRLFSSLNNIKSVSDPERRKNLPEALEAKEVFMALERLPADFAAEHGGNNFAEAFIDPNAFRTVANEAGENFSEGFTDTAFSKISSWIAGMSTILTSPEEKANTAREQAGKRFWAGLSPSELKKQKLIDLTISTSGAENENDRQKIELQFKYNDALVEGIKLIQERKGLTDAQMEEEIKKFTAGLKKKEQGELDALAKKEARTDAAAERADKKIDTDYQRVSDDIDRRIKKQEEHDQKVRGVTEETSAYLENLDNASYASKASSIAKWEQTKIAALGDETKYEAKELAARLQVEDVARLKREALDKEYGNNKKEFYRELADMQEEAGMVEMSQLDKFRNSIDRKLEAQLEELKNKLKPEDLEEASEEAKKLAKWMKESSSEAIALGDDPLKGFIQGLKDSTKEAITLGRVGREMGRVFTSELGATFKEIFSGKNENPYADSITSINEKIKSMQYESLEGGLAQLEWLRKEYDQSLAGAMSGNQDMFDQYMSNLDSYLDKAKEEMNPEEYKELYAQTMEDLNKLNDEFAGKTESTWDRIGDAFGDMADRILDKFLDLVANMAAQNIVGAMGGLFNSGSTAGSNSSLTDWVGSTVNSVDWSWLGGSSGSTAGGYSYGDPEDLFTSYSSGWASGGWLGANPQGGVIRQGSGTRDDVFLGMTGRTANYGMGGEFVINKQSTSAYLPLLEAINAQGFASGGRVGSSDNLTYLLKQLSDQGIITTGSIAGLVEANGPSIESQQQAIEATQSLTQATQQSTQATVNSTHATVSKTQKELDLTDAIVDAGFGFAEATTKSLGMSVALGGLAAVLGGPVALGVGLVAAAYSSQTEVAKDLAKTLAETRQAVKGFINDLQDAALSDGTGSGISGDNSVSGRDPDKGSDVWDSYGDPNDLGGGGHDTGGISGDNSVSGRDPDKGSDVWASGGQAGSNYIVNKRATAKYLPLLTSLNSRGFADGGLMDNNTYSRYRDTVRFNGLEDYQIAFIELNESFEEGIKELQELGASEEDLAMARAAQAIEIRKMIDDTIEESKSLVENYGLSDYAISVNELNAKYQEQLDTLIYLSAAEGDLSTVRRAQQIETDAMIEELVSSSRQLIEDSKLSDQQIAVRDLNAAYDEKIANLRMLKAAEEDVLLVEQARAMELYKVSKDNPVVDKTYITDLGDILEELGKSRVHEIGNTLQSKYGWSDYERANTAWIGSAEYEEVNSDLASRIMGGKTMSELLEREESAKIYAARQEYLKNRPENQFAANNLKNIERLTNIQKSMTDKLIDLLREAESALSEAESALKDSFSAHNSSLIEKFDESMSKLDESISSASDSANTLASALDSIFGMSDFAQYNYAQAQAELSRRFSSGDVSGDLSGLSYSTAFDTNTFGNKLDYSRSVARTGIMLTGLKSIADSNLDLLEKQKTEETKKHEEILKSNEDRLNALLGIKTTVLSIQEAAAQYLERRKAYESAYSEASRSSDNIGQPREFSNTVADVANEIKALRAEMKTQQHAAVKATQEMTRYIRRWDGDGMPETRVV